MFVFLVFQVLPGATPVFQPIHGNPVNNVISSSPPSFATSEPETGTEGFYSAARNRRQSQEPPYSPKEPPYSPMEPTYNVPQEPGTSHQVVDPSGPSRHYPPGPSKVKTADLLNSVNSLKFELW